MNSAVIFDFDGVLLDSFDCLYELNKEAFTAFGLPFSRRAYRALFAGNFHKTVRGNVPADRLEAFREFKAKIFPGYYRRAKLFPFAKSLAAGLSRTHGLAVVSSTRKPYIEAKLKRGGIRRHFKVVAGSWALSKEGEIAEACRRMGVKKSQAVFVSDTMGDIKLGRKLGMQTAGVAWGFHSRAMLKKAGAHACFSDHRSLLRHLLGTP